MKQNYAKMGRRAAEALLCIGLCSVLNAGPPAENAAKPAPSVKSEFTDDPKFGKDPFFPNSERRKATNETNIPTDVQAPAIKLKLQGISGPSEKRLGIVNNRTFAVGEEAEMKVDGKSYKVHCLEIKEHSVIMEVNGQRQELTLGARF